MSKPHFNPNPSAWEQYGTPVASGQMPLDPSSPAAIDGAISSGASFTDKAALVFAGVAVGLYFLYAYLKNGKLSVDEMDKKNIAPNIHNLLTVTVAAIIGIVLLKLGVSNAAVSFKRSKIGIVNSIGKYVLAPLAKFIQIS